MSISAGILKYPKQYILVEDKSTKIYKSLYDHLEFENVDDYVFSVVTSITQEMIGNEIWHLIQHEDTELGWIKLSNSIQIYRYQPKLYKVIESVFQPNELNERMGISKDFISHFKDNMLTVKSEITYNGEKYYSVFLKNKFHGFHKAAYLDPLIELKLPIDKSNIISDEIYSNSKLNNPVSHVPEFQKGLLNAAFLKIGIASVVIQGNTYWTPIESLIGINIPELANEEKSIEQLKYDDLMYSAHESKQKSIDMLKTIIGAKDYLNNTEVRKYLSLASPKNSTDNIDEIKDELKSIKNENLDLRRKLRQSQNDFKLASNRLEHQLEYKERLEAQKDKYKERMELVEDKLANLDDKYKILKKQKSGIRKFF